MSSIRNNKQGFTLVELLVSIFVAAVIISSLNLVVTSYVHVGQRGRYMNMSNSFVEGKMEELRNLGYNGISTGTSSLTSQLPTQLPPSRAATMTVTTPQSGLKQIDISVTYKDQGQSRSYAYTTYIGELGVGQ